MFEDIMENMFDLKKKVAGIGLRQYPVKRFFFKYIETKNMPFRLKASL